MEGKHVARNKQIQRQTIITMTKHRKTKGEQHEPHKQTETEPQLLHCFTCDTSHVTQGEWSNVK